MARALPASVALAAMLALLPAGAHGQEAGPPPAPPGEPESPAPGTGQPPPAAEAAPPKPGALETSHAAVEEQLRDLVDWLDRFFGDRRYLEFGPQRSTVRWRSEVRLTDEPHAYPHTTGLVDLRLPAATAWLSRAHLVLSGDQLPGEGAPGGEEPATEVTAGQGRLELRYDLLRRPGSLLYLGGGIRFAWPPDPFVRIRLRQDFHPARSLLARFTPTAFWELSQGLGGTLQLDLDQGIAGEAVLRASGGLLRSEKSRGLEWGTSLELRAPLERRLVGALGGSMRGVQQSAATVEQYRTYARLRADVFRQWLFAEVEPEMVFPANPAGGYRTILGVIVRLEVLFVSEITASPPPTVGIPTAPAVPAPVTPAPAAPGPAAPEAAPSREPPAGSPPSEIPWP